MPQQWLAHTTAPGVASDDRRRLDLVIYGATPLGGAICCDATLVLPLRRDGTPHAGAQLSHAGRRGRSREVENAGFAPIGGYTGVRSNAPSHQINGLLGASGVREHNIKVVLGCRDKGMGIMLRD